MIQSQDAVGRAERLNQLTVVERPARIAVNANHGIAVALVDVVKVQAAEIVIAALEGVEAFYHSSPSIRQFRPLPIPKKATLLPDCRTSRSSASAAVMGSDTVPIFPK